MSLAELKPVSARGVFVQKQRANVYTMMLIVSFLFIIIACMFLYMEMGSYHFKVKVPPDFKAANVHPPAPTLGSPGS